MSPDCTFIQTLTNLKKHAVQVFEAILKGESRDILRQVKAIREQRIWPTCRARHQILGERYQQMIEQTFSTTLPLVHEHLKKRAYFCEYLMLTGIFNNPELDIEHSALYQRILNEYLWR